jgi:hypothetical protein
MTISENLEGYCCSYLELVQAGNNRLVLDLHFDFLISMILTLLNPESFWPSKGQQLQMLDLNSICIKIVCTRRMVSIAGPFLLLGHRCNLE